VPRYTRGTRRHLSVIELLSNVAFYFNWRPYNKDDYVIWRHEDFKETLALYRTMSAAAKMKSQAAQHHERVERAAATARGEEYQPSTTYRETWAARRAVTLSRDVEALRVAFAAAKRESKMTWDQVVEK